MSDVTPDTAPTQAQLMSMSDQEQEEAIKNWFHNKFGYPDFEFEQTSAEGGYVSMWSASDDEAIELRSRFEGVVSDEVFEKCLTALVYEVQVWDPDDEDEDPLPELETTYKAWLTAHPNAPEQTLQVRLEALEIQLSKLSGYNGGPVIDATTDDPSFSPEKIGKLQLLIRKAITGLKNSSFNRHPS
jgi:hypothetical protein